MTLKVALIPCDALKVAFVTSRAPKATFRAGAVARAEEADLK